MTGSLTCGLLVCASLRRGMGHAYVGDGDGLIVVAAKILKQVLDQDGALSDLAIDIEILVVARGEADLLAGGGFGGHGVGVMCRLEVG